MRNELYRAGGDARWLSAPDGEVIAEYNRLTSAASGGAGGSNNWSGLWGALTGSNQEQFDEMKRQFQQGQYTNLAQSLLSGAASLRGPEDWLKYAQYTTGGQNLFQRLWGNAAAPDFGVSGYSAPATIDSILRDLGLSGGGTSGTGSYQTINGVKSVEQMRAELKGANYPNWQKAGPQELANVYGRTSKGAVTPMAAQATAPTGTPTGKAAQQSTVPNPYQVNPAVWDSLSGTAKTIMLAAAEAGKTPSGAWSAEDWLNQLNASRPKGYAPKDVGVNWGKQQSYW
jgi:hypothetical protein